MAIFDEATNTKIDVVKIYDVVIDSAVEEDVQDVFFTRFELLMDKREIHIENERKKHFIFNVDKKTVRAIDN